MGWFFGFKRTYLQISVGRNPIKKSGLLYFARIRPLSLMRSGYPCYFGSLLLSLTLVLTTKKHNHFGIESKKNIIILDLNSNKTFVTIQPIDDFKKTLEIGKDRIYSTISFFVLYLCQTFTNTPLKSPYSI
jgi:hypothetical protein